MVNAMPGMAQLPPEAAGPAPMTGEEMSPDSLAAFEQMRQEMPPSEFANDLLDTAQEADPVAVAEFRAELQDLALPPEVLDVLDQLTDEVLAAPDMYPQIRAKYLAQDIPEDLLPPAFEPEFFGALNLAVDQIRGSSDMAMPPMGFARGGIASLNPIAKAMAKQGRYGDTILAHISPREAEMLKDMGGSGTINPMTGMPEFFIKKAFKSAKNALKKVGQAVKKFAQSSVGKIVTTMALAFFLGPAAAQAMGGIFTSAVGKAAVSGFVGSAGSTALAGGNLKESLKAGATAALVAGAGAGVMGGADAFKIPDPSTVAPATVGGQMQRAREFVTGRPAQAAPTGATSFPVEQQPPLMRAPMESQGIGSLPETGAGGTVNLGSLGQQPSGPSFGFPSGGQPAPASSIAAAPLTDSQILGGMFGRPEARFDPTPIPSRNLIQQGLDKILPGRIEAAAQDASGKAFQPAYDRAYNASLSSVGPERARVIAEEAGRKAVERAANPGMLRQYGPLAATGLGIMALTGGFKEEDVAPPPGFEDFMSGSPGQRLLDQDPRRYGLSYGGVNTTSTTPQYNPYSYTPPRPTGYAKGGSTDQHFPRKTGPINGPGTGTSDDIPAMLSDGEFVFTAKAVRGMGDGSRRKGAQRMYALMRKLEGRSNG
jgi:hypothetical protein